MSEAMFTFRVDEHLKADFTEAARANNQTDAQLLRELMRRYVEQHEDSRQYDQWLSKKVERSRAAVRAGRSIPAAEVEALFATLRSKAKVDLESN